MQPHDNQYIECARVGKFAHPRTFNTLSIDSLSKTPVRIQTDLEVPARSSADGYIWRFFPNG